MCPRERFSLYKSLSRLVLCYKKDWATLLHFIYFCYLLLVTNYLITKLSVTYNFSACREYLAENRLSFPSAPRWVQHSYLSKRDTIDPIYLWVISNTGAIALAKESRFHTKTKHIKRRFNSIRDLVKEGDIEICKIHTDLNVADPLTKPLPRAKHDQDQDSMDVRFITM